MTRSVAAATKQKFRVNLITSKSCEACEKILTKQCLNQTVNFAANSGISLALSDVLSCAKQKASINDGDDIAKWMLTFHSA